MTHITVRNKVIKFELGNKLPFIQGDRIQLQQVLLNLISNSLEAMDESSDSRELLIRTSRKDNDTIMVEVKDSGCGIPAENMKKLFAHFLPASWMVWVWGCLLAAPLWRRMAAVWRQRIILIAAQPFVSQFPLI